MFSIKMPVQLYTKRFCHHYTPTIEQIIKRQKKLREQKELKKKQQRKKMKIYFDIYHDIYHSL